LGRHADPATSVAPEPVELSLRPENLSVSRLTPGQRWPEAPDDGSLFSATSSGDERSLVCRADLAPEGPHIERGWRALTVAGPLDFALVGVMAGLTAPLARAGVGVFVLSTFETDHLLVRLADLEMAVDALTAAGHTVRR
jgi:hypothetical protein